MTVMYHELNFVCKYLQALNIILAFTKKKVLKSQIKVSAQIYMYINIFNFIFIYF